MISNGTTSPTNALGRKSPPGTVGEDPVVGMRPIAVSRAGCASDAGRTGIEAALRQGWGCAVRDVTTVRTYRDSVEGYRVRGGG